MSAERGWIGEPQPPRTSVRGEERKWRIMMGNGQFLTDGDTTGLAQGRAMGVSVRGVVHEHLHSPCPRCGYATRFKQFPTRCACNRSDPKPFTFPWENDPAWQERIRQAKQRVAEHEARRNEY